MASCSPLAFNRHEAGSTFRQVARVNCGHIETGEPPLPNSAFWQVHQMLAAQWRRAWAAWTGNA